jgi:Cu+-exporting ATPase
LKTVLNEILANPPLSAMVAAAEALDAPAQERRRESSRAPCFHCGEICRNPDLARGDKVFCCRGCMTVHDLLNQTGLAHFYDLSAAPGVRIRREARQSQYAYLDEPAVQERLLDFTNGKISRVSFVIPAIHCVACVWLLENLFRLHAGIGRSRVNFSRREVSITFAPGNIKLSELVTLLVSIGYEPELTLGQTEKKSLFHAQKKEWLQIGLAAFAFGNIMLMSLPFYLGLDSASGPWFREMAGWLNLAMALPVVTFSARDFWRAAWVSLRGRTLTLEVPIALGLAAIYGRSVFDVLLHRGPGFCDSLCGLIFFLLCGRLFQKKTYDRLTFDRDYKGFFPLAVIRKTDRGEEQVAIPQLKTGDHLILRHGELLPADARLVSGDARMDYSCNRGIRAGQCGSRRSLICRRETGRGND